MRYLSLFSGIEAASVAWHPLGWEPVAFAEVEPFPSAVLAERFPNVPNLGDVTKFKEWPDVCNCVPNLFDESSEQTRPSSVEHNGQQGSVIHSDQTAPPRGGYCKQCGGFDGSIDLIVGGSPCQSFSVAGLRKGMDDPRGNLALTYLAIVEKYRPEWIVWENVPGVLSSNGGRDFGSFLGALDEIGYGYAWRVLDAQYVRTPDYPRAVPQRRRRVFVVGNLRDWRRAAAVLFDSESLCGNPPPRREKRQGTSVDAQEGIRSDGHGLTFQNIVGAKCADDSKQVQNQSVSQDKLIVESTATDFKIRGGSEVETGEQGGTPGRKAGKGYLGSDELAFTVASVQDQNIFQAVDVYTQAIDGDVSATVTKAVGGTNTSGPKVMVYAQDEIAGTLDASYYKGCGERGGTEREFVAYENHGTDSRITPLSQDEPSPTIAARWGTGGNNQALVQAVAFEPGSIARNAGPSGEDTVCPTLRSNMGDNQPAVRIDNAQIYQASELRLQGKMTPKDVCPTLKADTKQGDSEPFAVLPLNTMAMQGRPSDNGKMTMGIGKDGDPSPTLGKAHSHAVAVDWRTAKVDEDITQTLKTDLAKMSGPFISQQAMQVRRLTPLECERLQGFPDGWTRIPWRKKSAEDCPDGPRYKAIGNSMAVNVMQWIGLRIALVTELGYAFSDENPDDRVISGASNALDGRAY